MAAFRKALPENQPDAHMKNYKDPLKKISKWMKKDGLYLFITFATKHLPTSLR
ncbi:hypothetical protein JHK82_022312 [Glycine max]|nr:hypothetical protein JHK87_022229 [Glycine soja]KAG5016662.1 hypothetical protein JHK85_022798 [Glycine max]KAG5026420.1 hypothetical protein JHK86_022334 [Glycine max]KAG5137581.1 hypothetical protein JHK82_022312 [Glycine max]